MWAQWPTRRRDARYSGRVIAYLGLFSTSFIIAMVLWPFAAAVLTLPILAGLYHRHHRLRLTAATSAYLSVLYLLGLVSFTLYPMPDEPQVYCAAHHLTPQLDPLRFIDDLRTGGLYGALQLLMNVALFTPLGFIIGRWLHARWRGALFGGFAVSLLIEISQLTGFWGLYPCTYRQFDVNDLMTNTLGALLGFGVAKLFGVWAPTAAAPGREDVNRKPGVLHRTVTLVIDMIFVAVVYFTLTIIVVLVFYQVARPLPNGDFQLFGLFAVGVDWLNYVAPVTAGLAFLLFELVIPLRHAGQTWGGLFTHMTVETKPRTGGRKALFYTVRTLVLGALSVMLVAGVVNGGGLAAIACYGFAALFLFGLFARRMPWDLLPGDKNPDLSKRDEEPIGVLTADSSGETGGNPEMRE
ncbi:teicoplanin resistance protein VanZ [Bifidobacterium lemurum]|uniref:Teicoplanin resistance protein VanZ n=1 Tax=Bifidobacterium lemurum TaxID=1603886 RepID=A0A261FKT4_9BIFI|nr:teicoplanin resistance protein VanZ [Bifidobacterium lemurum]